MMILLGLLLLHTFAAGGAAGHLPASLVVLPRSSITDSALLLEYTCAPTYSSSPCSGHGDCYVLLDSTVEASKALLNCSTTQPVSASSSALDTHGIDSSTSLPAAACLCHSGYTGRGDYIHHYALDGDSCGISEHATAGLSITGVVLFAMIFALALDRLSRWFAWYRRLAQNGAAASMLSSQLSSDCEVMLSQVRPQSGTTNGVAANPNRITSPRAAPFSASATGSAFQSDCTDRAARGAMNTAGEIPNGATAISLPFNHKRSHPDRGSASRRAAFGHLSFSHPLCSSVVATTTMTFYILRLTTSLTLGESIIMSMLCYTAYQGYFIGSCIATYHTLRLAATITRTHTGAGGLSAVMRRVRVCMYSLVSCSAIVWLLLFALPCLPQATQQTTSILVLTVLYAPVWALGIVSATATRRITSALVLNLDQLSPLQREARVAICTKLRSQQKAVVVMVLINISVCCMLLSSDWLRQAGLPYFQLFSQYFCLLTLSMRLSLIQPPGRPAPVAPHSVQLPATKSALLASVSKASPTAASIGNASLVPPISGVRGAVSGSRQPESSRLPNVGHSVPGQSEQEALNSTRESEPLDDSAATLDVHRLEKLRLSVVTDLD